MNGAARATISHFGRSYEIERTDSTGLGRYVELKISGLDSTGPAATPQRFDVATCSTCGHYRDEGTKLVIYEPHGFRYGFFSFRINNLLWPRKSRIDFRHEGATPSFLPTDDRD